MTYSEQPMLKRLSVLLTIFLLLPGFIYAQINNEDKPTEPHDILVHLQDESQIFYRTKGHVLLNFSDYIVNKRGFVSLPINIQPEVSLGKNITIGPVASYFQFKNTTTVEPAVTRIEDGNIKYHQLVVGVKGSYHFMPILQKASKKPLLVDYVDPYITAWVGYSWVFSHSSYANPLFISANQKLRGGAAIGVRTMVLPRFGFHVEAGFSSIGYGSFGITTIFN